MKTVILGSLAAGLMAVAPAHAGTRIDWHIGFGSSGCDSRREVYVKSRGHHHHSSHRSHDAHRRVTYRPTYRSSSCDSRPRGHWETVCRKVWVEGYWEIERQSCGRSVRRWHPGYHKTVSERVWVSY